MMMTQKSDPLFDRLGQSERDEIPTDRYFEYTQLRNGKRMSHTMAIWYVNRRKNRQLGIQRGLEGDGAHTLRVWGVELYQSSNVSLMRLLLEQIEQELKYDPNNGQLLAEQSLAKEAVDGWDRWARIN